MQVRYDLGVDDVAAFQTYVMNSNSRINHQVNIFFGVASVLFSIGFLLWGWLADDTGAYFSAIVTPTLLWLVARPLLKWILPWYSRWFLRKAQFEGGLGNHLQELTSEGIRTVTSVSDSLIRWSGILRIEETDDYAFLFVQTFAAYVIPKHRLIEGDALQFIAQAKDLLARSRQPTEPV